MIPFNKVNLRDRRDFFKIIRNLSEFLNVNNTEDLCLIHQWIIDSRLEDNWPHIEFFKKSKELLENGIDEMSILKFKEDINSFISSIDNFLAIQFYKTEFVSIKNTTFLFTGTLRIGPRKMAEEIVNHLGGIFTDGFRYNLEYLVVGDNSLETFFSSKIQSALSSNSLGNHKYIKIIPESVFVNSLPRDDAKLIEIIGKYQKQKSA